MNKAVQDYIKSKNNLLKYFNCRQDYYVKPLENVSWTVKSDGDIHILAYWDEKKAPTEAVIARNGGEPLIFRKSEYTMVVAIDCVKIAFLLRNDMEM